MTTSLIVPWRAGDPEREALWDFCRRWWGAHYPEFELIEVDSAEEPFSRGGSRNLGAEKAKGDVLLFADADTLASQVEAAVELAERGAWCIAYAQGSYCSLTEEATDKLLRSDPALDLAEPSRAEWRARITSYSGVFAMPREAFEAVEGYDPRFKGYGGEDMAIMFALDTLWTPHQRTAGWAVHLYHEHRDEERFANPLWPANDALCKRYQECYGNVSAMRALTRERA